MKGFAEPSTLKERGILRLRITAIIIETSQAKTFFLDFVEDAIEYRSGQFVTLVFQTKHGEKRRSYSISSSPELGEPLTITVKRVENGEFSRLLHSHARVGDILFCSGINGLFVLPGKIDTYNQYWFIAAGSGITPCFSLIKMVLHRSNARIILVFSNRSREETIFYEKLVSLEQSFSTRFQIHFLFSNLYDIYNSRLSSWLLDNFISRHLITPENEVFYLCGPFEYMRMATITLRQRVAEERIIRENFSSLPRLIIPRPPDMQPHIAILLFKNQVFRLPVQYPQTILAAAKDAQIPVPYSCEAGRCGSCVAKCVEGKVWMAYNEVLLDAEVQAGMVLLCQAVPIEGDVKIQC